MCINDHVIYIWIIYILPYTSIPYQWPYDSVLYPRNLTNISKKMSVHSQKEEWDFLSPVYSWITPHVLVCGWYMTVLVYKWSVNITKLTKIGNSGIQVSMYRNLVCGQYVTKKAIQNCITNFLLCCWQKTLHWNRLCDQ